MASKTAASPEVRFGLRIGMVLLLLLGGAAALLGSRAAEGPADAGFFQPEQWAFVERIEITNRTGRIVLNREPGSKAGVPDWRLEGFDFFSVNPERVGMLLKQLSTLKVRERFSLLPAERERAGLTTPAASVQLTADRVVVRVSLGAVNQYLGERHAEDSGAAGAWWAPPGLWEALQIDRRALLLAETASQSFFAFPRARVARAEFDSAAGESVLLVRSTAGWQVNSTAADPLFVEQLLKNLELSQCRGWVRRGVALTGGGWRLVVAAVGGAELIALESGALPGVGATDERWHWVRRSGRNTACILDEASLRRITPRLETLVAGDLAKWEGSVSTSRRRE